MKKLFFATCLVVLAGTGLKAQDLYIDNQTTCNVWVDFYHVAGGCNGVGLGGANYTPSTTPYGPYTAPPGRTWSYGLIGSPIGGIYSCSSVSPAIPCLIGNHIQMSDGVCALPAQSSGCVTVDASSSCTNGCLQFTVTAVYNTPNPGDCTLTITP
jgi:hypothetical protein